MAVDFRVLDRDQTDEQAYVSINLCHETTSRSSLHDFFKFSSQRLHSFITKSKEIEAWAQVFNFPNSMCFTQLVTPSSISNASNKCNMTNVRSMAIKLIKPWIVGLKMSFLELHLRSHPYQGHSHVNCETETFTVSENVVGVDVGELSFIHLDLGAFLPIWLSIHTAWNLGNPLLSWLTLRSEPGNGFRAIFLQNKNIHAKKTGSRFGECLMTARRPKRKWAWES